MDDLKRLKASEIWVWRKIERISGLVKVKNKKVQEWVKERRILETIMERKRM